MTVEPRHSTTAQFIAIDGGGTRCRVALRHQGRDITAEVGSANVTSDFDAALQQISLGLTQVAEQAGLADLSAVPAYLGLAGVAGPAMADRVRAALPFKFARVEDDRRAAVRGALGRQDGAIAHCGTGSFFATQINGLSRFSGGWGPVLGDEASAQWVGRRALTLTLASVDGLAPETALARHCLETYGGAAGIVAFAANAKQVEFGHIAPAVTQHAATGDALACQILQEAADVLAQTLPELGWRNDMTLCLTGGIARFYGPYLPENMKLMIRDPAGEPLSGALTLAQDFYHELANGEVHP